MEKDILWLDFFHHRFFFNRYFISTKITNWDVVVVLVIFDIHYSLSLVFFFFFLKKKAKLVDKNLSNASQATSDQLHINALILISLTNYKTSL